ncbi:hypothetical protein [Ekhidna sp.]|uniref:hypothetical protein n=1 Tax=Ekhidna sp. TaxID=2608089 RepID=UPI003B593637
MEANFKISENIAVELDGRHIDLHNNFDFELITKTSTGYLLQFVRNSGNWVRTDEYRRLTFELTNVNFEHFEEGDPKATKEDANCLGELTFFPSELRKMNDSIAPQTEPKKDDDIIFIFEDGKLFRFGCERIELNATENNA